METPTATKLHLLAPRPTANAALQQHVAAVADIIKSETNVKEVEFLTDVDFLKKSIKANFRVTGKRSVSR